MTSPNEESAARADAEGLSASENDSSVGVEGTSPNHPAASSESSGGPAPADVGAAPGEASAAQAAETTTAAAVAADTQHHQEATPAQPPVDEGSSAQLRELLKKLGEEPWSLEDVESRDAFVRSYTRDKGKAALLDAMRETFQSNEYELRDKVTWELNRLAAILEKVELASAKRQADRQSLREQHASACERSRARAENAREKLRQTQELLARMKATPWPKGAKVRAGEDVPTAQAPSQARPENPPREARPEHPQSEARPANPDSSEEENPWDGLQ
eukprot:TRINITY_DN17306_c0_g1_i2.p1 TRINITY_DN17306_c0_g1~~TRINITY_DN17306_c0_g1_i2.p1  ORF type:complete len:321 (+),score=74.79 TRINITY_DN17306_c0_g1_i2:140-964(+)